MRKRIEHRAIMIMWSLFVIAVAAPGPVLAGAAIGGSVWSDANNDGIRDLGEAGIGGVRLNLVSAGDDDTFDTGDDVIEDTTTLPDGSYLFSELAAGEYRVDVDQSTVPAGYDPHADPSVLVTVADDEVRLDVDFACFGASRGSIGNLLWLDNDYDGFFDGSEPGISGVSISVYHDTNENGLIDGIDVIDGELDVDDSGTIDGGDDGTWGNAYAIIDGQLDIDGDGAVEADDDGTLVGITVIDGQLDIDGDGAVDGDPDDDGSLGEPSLATTFTDPTGFYLFDGLPLDDGKGDGDFDYLVDVTDIFDVLSLLRQTFGVPGVDNNGQVDPYAVALTAVMNVDETADFSFAPATPPVALCQDVEVQTGEGVCHADASINDGSFDLDGDPITETQTPPGPYGLGTTSVDLTVSDGTSEDTCSATVTVVDEAPPIVQCNAPSAITPADAPISFVASAVDNCSVETIVIEDFDCFKVANNGRIIDKTDSCVVVLDGNTITVIDSGGVGNNIQWGVTVSDISGNAITTSCGVTVTNRRGR